MIDHILGKPSPTFRRVQVFLVIFFWSWRLYVGDLRRRSKRKLRVLGERKVWGLIAGRQGGGFLGIMGLINRKLKQFSPYQLVVGTLTLMYALRNLDVIVGLGSPEPLARMYSRAYYRATYISTSLDAGFATAASIRPKWVRDLASVVLGGWYLVWVREGDEKLRRFRSVCTVEMLRVTWEKTSNPYLRLLTHFDRPSLPLVKKLLLPRPKSSKHTKPISCQLFSPLPLEELKACTEIMLDFPGGGFVAMGPEHHEERLRRWAKRTGKPVLAVDYGKAPEYPYPWAIEEGFDVYQTLVQTKGSVIGINSGQLDIIMSGDSAGGNIVTTIMLNILESSEKIKHPLALVLAYPAIDFNYNSWMTPQDLQVLRVEQSSGNLAGIMEGKDHMRHKSPLSVVSDTQKKKSVPDIKDDLSRKSSWQRSLSGRLRQFSGERAGSRSTNSFNLDGRREEEKSLRERVKTPAEEVSMEALQQELRAAAAEAQEEEENNRLPIGTRLTMTSRTGYFQDRIISPTMMRAMAILYIGPRHNPDFATDYYISPILTPEKLLAQFPRTYLICGEKDPFVDDTVILAGRLRQAKRNRREEARREKAKRLAQARAGLRMSRADSNTPDDKIIDEEEDDWLSMRIIEGWGHGFMQMLSVMKHDVEPVLLDIADWIDETFAQAAVEREVKQHRRSQSTPLPRSFSLVKAAKYKETEPEKPLGSADLGGPLALDSETEGEDDDETDDVLSFSTKKTRMSFSQSMPNGLSSDRSPSVPNFSFSGESSNGPLTPPYLDESRFNTIKPSKQQRESYAFFTQKKAETPRIAVPTYLKNRTISPAGSDHAKGGLSEAELMRRRRVEAVFGMVDEPPTNPRHDDDDDGEDEAEQRGFRW